MRTRPILPPLLASLLAFAVLTARCGSKSPTSPSSSALLTVASVAPHLGPVDVSGTVTISGTGFESGATVTFGGVPATASVLNSTTISAQPPAHAEGVVDLVVTNRAGQSAILARAYTYALMAATGISPAEGIISKWVRLRGFGFRQGASVTFDDFPASVLFESSTSLFALAPVHQAGLADVVVTNPGGPDSTLRRAFRYHEVVLEVSQSVIPPGKELTVHWWGAAGQLAGDWIGLYKVGAPNAKVIWSDYTGNFPSGSRTILAPAEPGEYEFRYLVDDLYNDAARSETVRVVR